MITISLTWFTFKIAGGVLFLGSVLALFFGTLPDNPSHPVGDAFRFVLWPLFLLWFIVFIVRGFML